MKLTNKEASEWLMAIKRDYIYGGDEDFDERRKIALDMGAEALKNQNTGHWIISERDYTPEEYFNWNKTYLYKCSNCGREYEAEEGMGENYCANCGAKMEGENNAEFKMQIKET